MMDRLFVRILGDEINEFFEYSLCPYRSKITRTLGNYKITIERKEKKDAN